MNKYLSIITLSVNGLNAPIKRHRVAEPIRTQPTYMQSTGGPPQNKRSTLVESEGMEKIFQANGHEKKAGVAILISEKIDLKKKP